MKKNFYFTFLGMPRFCVNCGKKISKITLNRKVKIHNICTECGNVYYKNPLIIVGTIPVFEDKILLCKRAIKPRINTWTIPAGFMEFGETLEAGAIRETVEETGSEIELTKLFNIIDIPSYGQVHVYYIAKVTKLIYGKTSESITSCLYGEKEIPWDNLSFSSVRNAIKYFFSDRILGQFNLHCYSVKDQ